MTETDIRPLPSDDSLSEIESLDQLGKVFFCGIGGSGMSVLAHILHEEGCPVSGSDLVKSAKTDELENEGIPVVFSQDADTVKQADTIVWSSAIPQSSPQMQEALKCGKRLAHRSDILAVIMKTHQSIAVAGTHGKTTTSSMIATILNSLPQDAPAGLAHPSFAIGGSIKTEHGIISGGHAGTGQWMIAEADESDGSFEKYHPAIAVITNAEGDHLDHYGSVKNYRSAFVEFASHATQGVVLCGDDEGAREVFDASSDDVTAHTIVYSTDSETAFREKIKNGLRNAYFIQISSEQEIADNEFHPTSQQEHNQSQDIEERFTVNFQPYSGAHSGFKMLASKYIGSDTIGLHIPGIHNARNATAALCAVLLAGCSLHSAIKGLESFRGAARRFDFQGEKDGVKLYNDYAHHPTEISVLLDAMHRRFPHAKIRVVFQPHTYSRTATYTSELVEALKKADSVMITSIFAAREDAQDWPGVTSKILIDQAQKQGVGERFALVSDMFEAARIQAHKAQSGDIIVTVGGGDINRVDSLILDEIGVSSEK